MSVLLGVLVLREKLGRVQVVALGLAIAGVVFLTLAYGSFPWISLTLAGSFGVYGLMKKRLPVSGPAGLATELTFLLPVGIFLVASAIAGGTASGAPTTMLILGTLVCNEPFPTDRLIGFLFVWTALALYTASLWMPALRRRRRRPSRSTPY